MSFFFNSLVSISCCWKHWSLRISYFILCCSSFCLPLPPRWKPILWPYLTSNRSSAERNPVRGVRVHWKLWKCFSQLLRHGSIQIYFLKKEKKRNKKKFFPSIHMDLKLEMWFKTKKQKLKRDNLSFQLIKKELSVVFTAKAWKIIWNVS